MQRIKLPVVRNQKVFFPAKAVCPSCRKRKVFEPHSMAILNAGAMREAGRGRYEMATDTRAFITLIWHGAHSGGKGALSQDAYVDVADNVANGQFDLYFCSTSCLRKFLNYCVDALEERMEAARSKNDDRSGVAKRRARAQKIA